jgi:hypothetical protein
MASNPSKPREPERRRDPEDGQVRTFAELQELCKDVYSPEQILAYWDTTCQPLQPTIIDLASDPFISAFKTQEVLAPPPRQRHLPPAPTSSTWQAHPMDASTLPPASEEVLLARNPFLINPDHQDRTLNMHEDPFMTQNLAGRKTGLSALFKAGGKAANTNWVQTLHAILGPGFANRKVRARTMLILLPVSMYLWVLCMWALLQHVSANICMLLTFLLMMTSFGSVLMWFYGKRWGPVSLLALGLLCFLAICLGTALGQQGWDLAWREVFWLFTGSQSLPTSASTAAGARIDAAVLAFRNETTGPIDSTSVDADRAVGLKDGDIFCVAPILSPSIASSDNIRVNYWAIGINCCQLSGSFTCDASRDPTGGYGVVQLDGGFPCPSCNQDNFRQAVLKAQAIHGLVSAPDALFVRYVSSPTHLKLLAIVFAISYLLLAALLGSLGISILGYLAWYYGFGHRHLGQRAQDVEDVQELFEKRDA